MFENFGGAKDNVLEDYIMMNNKLKAKKAEKEEKAKKNKIKSMNTQKEYKEIEWYFNQNMYEL